MHNFSKALLLTGLLGLSGLSAFSAEHGGGNGGDDLELELKKISLQIGYFVKSDMGSKAFKNINADALIEVTNNLDINVVSTELTDKYGAVRTCLNEPDKALITCNLNRVAKQSEDKKVVLVGLLFHEILGLMEIELGYQENVSMYPISSKILPYTDIVLSTPVSESQIRPEFYGLDNRSYGITLINKDTKETIRMICLNDNVEVHRCRNYSLVRQAQGIQAPLIPEVISISPTELRESTLTPVTLAVVNRLNAELEANKAKGYKYLTFAFYENGQYVYGAGVLRPVDVGPSAGEILMMATIGTVFVLGIPDNISEVAKQTGNAIIYPFKAALTALKSSSIKSEIKKLNKNIEVARNVLNLDDDLSIVGTSKSISGEDYKQVINVLTQSVVLAKKRSLESK